MHNVYVLTKAGMSEPVSPMHLPWAVRSFFTDRFGRPWVYVSLRPLRSS